MEQVLARRDAIGVIAQRLAPGRALLGRRRQRAEPDRRATRCGSSSRSSATSRSPCDAHRGQEAHRPLRGAADPRVRAPGSDGLQRRRRRQGGRDLPGPQGRGGGGRRPGRRPVRRRARDDRGARRSTPRSAFVLSAMVGHLFGYEAALAIDAPAHPLREARAAIEAVVTAPRAPEPVRRRAPRASSSKGPRRASSTSSAAASTTARSRRAPRCGWPRSSGTRPGCSRSTRSRWSTARSARPAPSSRT